MTVFSFPYNFVLFLNLFIFSQRARPTSPNILMRQPSQTPSKCIVLKVTAIMMEVCTRWRKRVYASGDWGPNLSLQHGRPNHETSTEGSSFDGKQVGYLIGVNYNALNAKVQRLLSSINKESS